MSKCFTLFGKPKDSAPYSPSKLFNILVLYLAFSEYVSVLSPENVSHFCHSFILIQMVWAREMEQKKDPEGLTLMMMLVIKFVKDIEEMISRSPKGCNNSHSTKFI